MKIAFFTDTFYPQINGVTNTLGYLSAYLTDQGIAHVFFAPDYEGEAHDNKDLPVIRFKGIVPHIYPECRIAFPPYGKVLEYLQDFKPDIIHIVTELGIGFTGLRAARELGIPIVMSYHTNYDTYLDFYNLSYLSRPIWSYIRWFHNAALVNLCPSVHTKKELERHGIKNLDIWSRGIDAGRFCPSHYSEDIRTELGGAGKTLFLYVGRIAKEKGLDTLAESIRIVNQIDQDRVQFVFTGDGPYLEELQAMTFPNAVFTGPHRGLRLAQIYASCDAFVFPSGSETFGNVMLEAMASGLPGICADAGGVTDFTQHGVNAYVSRYRDADALAAAITAMTDKDLRETLRAGGLETARARSWQAIFKRLCETYEKTLASVLVSRQLAG